MTIQQMGATVCLFGGVFLAGVSVYAHVKSDGDIGSGWGAIAFIMIIAAVFNL